MIRDCFFIKMQNPLWYHSCRNQQGKYNGKLFVIKAVRDKALNHVGTAEFHKVNGCHK